MIGAVAGGVDYVKTAMLGLDHIPISHRSASAWLGPPPEQPPVRVKGLLASGIRQDGQPQFVSQDLQSLMPTLQQAVCSDMILVCVGVGYAQDRLIVESVDELRCRMCTSGIDEHTVNKIGSRPVLSEKWQVPCHVDARHRAVAADR